VLAEADHLAILAYHQGKLSEGQLARMLRMDRVAARMKVEEARSRFNAEEDDTYKNLELNLASPLGGR
jgi:hypothetical protein